jgi:catechol 2,3-dioxygenase-like lactoylglutathione lyase family enzyme
MATSRTRIVLGLTLLFGFLGRPASQALSSGSGRFDQTPAFGPAHFHHLHLNSVDPAAAITFYTSKFDCERGRLAGLLDGVWAQKSWLLFNKVSAPPPWELTSAIWHFGWGAEDMKATYEKQLASGTKFFTPLSDISDLAGVPNFYYAYVDGPDHALIELNTAGHHRFGHLHLFSEDPVSAGQWYVKYFGAIRRATSAPSREPRFYKGFQVGPSMSLMMDNVNIIIFPIQLSKQSYPDQWKNNPSGIAPTRGRVVDHVGFSVDDLPATLELLRKDGVKITDEMKSVAGGKIKYAFIEGPDQIRIELVEGQARKE